MLLLAISKGSAWGWSSVEILGIFAASAVLLTLFVLIERRVRQPLVDLATLRDTAVRRCQRVRCTVRLLVLLDAPTRSADRRLPHGKRLWAGLLDARNRAHPAPHWTRCPRRRVGSRADHRSRWAAGARRRASALGIAAYVFLTLSHDTAVALTTGSAAVGLAIGSIMTSIFSVVARRRALTRRRSRSPSTALRELPPWPSARRSRSRSLRTQGSRGRFPPNPVIRAPS